MNQGLSFMDDMKKVEDRIEDMDSVLGIGSLMPFNPINSGSRKLMHSQQVQQIIALSNPEVPIIQTGTENLFGHSSSFYQKMETNCIVTHCVPKYGHVPYHIYTLFVKDEKADEYDIIERIPAEHLTETYGVVFNNTYLDDHSYPGAKMKMGDTVIKTTSYDRFDNRADGVNLLTTYVACEYTKEDGIVISESAAKKLMSPLIKPISLIINENDIPLNLYGDDNNYKCLPDINEMIKDGILCGLRREKKEETLYSMAYNRLKELMSSDDKIMTKGRVVDIDVYCNNPEVLKNSLYSRQLYFYHTERVRYMEEFVGIVDGILDKGSSITHNIEKRYYEYKRILGGAQYLRERPFNNVLLNCLIVEESIASKADKITNRYSSKGVISAVLPDDMMPMSPTGDRVEVMLNPSAPINRENVGQLFESSINYISSVLCMHIALNISDLQECKEKYLKFVECVVPKQHEELAKFLDSLDEDELEMYLNNVVNDNGIMLSIRPVDESMDIDGLAALYRAFPEITQYYAHVPQQDSMGNVRFIKSRRPTVCGRQYFYRLKQYAEESFSAVSLASTNLKGEPTRNMMKKSFKTPFGKTPIRNGNMEIEDQGHMGMYKVITNLMLHSSSPHGRQITESLYSGDPFDVNVDLDGESLNRSAEINALYLLTIGLELKFIKRKKLAPKHIVYKHAIRMYPHDDSFKEIDDKNLIRVHAIRMYPHDRE
jgi:DNA-directed RNA polymerase beta subunit